MTQLHELLAVLIQKYEALAQNRDNVEAKLQDIEATQAALFDSMQEAHTQQLLTEAVLSEFIQETSTELDRINTIVEALRKQAQVKKIVTGWGGWLDKILAIFRFARRNLVDIDQAIIDEQSASLKRQLSNLIRHLDKLKERQARYGIDTPVHIEIQIEDYESKIDEIITQIESLDDD